MGDRRHLQFFFLLCVMFFHSFLPSQVHKNTTDGPCRARQTRLSGLEQVPHLKQSYFWLMQICIG